MLRESSLGETWVLCFIANRFVGPMYRAIEDAADITRPEFVVLLCVGHLDGLVAQDVSDMSGLPRNTISRGVNRLIASGFLERASTKGGQRDKVLRLTASGLALRDRLLEYPMRQRDKLRAQITPKERATLERLLLKVAVSAPRWAGELE